MPALFNNLDNIVESSDTFFNSILKPPYRELSQCWEQIAFLERYRRVSSYLFGTHASLGFITFYIRYRIGYTENKLFRHPFHEPSALISTLSRLQVAFTCT